MHLVVYFVTREMGLGKIYPYTKFEVSSFTGSRFMEEGLNTDEMGLAQIYPYTKFEAILSSPVSNLGKGF